MPSDKRRVLECLDKSTPVDISEQFGFSAITVKKRLKSLHSNPERDL